MHPWRTKISPVPSCPTELQIRTKNPSEDVSEVWWHYSTISYWNKITEAGNDKKLSVKEKMSREKLMLVLSTEKLLTIDRSIQANGKAGKTRQKGTFCAFAWAGESFQRRLQMLEPYKDSSRDCAGFWTKSLVRIATNTENTMFSGRILIKIWVIAGGT